MRIMMLINMRTTLTVDDDLLVLARQRADSQRLSLVEVINRALRRGLAEDPAPRLAEPTIVYGDAGTVGPDDQALRVWAARLDDEAARRDFAP
jgi:hypothetical protein